MEEGGDPGEDVEEEADPEGDVEEEGDPGEDVEEEADPEGDVEEEGGPGEDVEVEDASRNNRPHAEDNHTILLNKFAVMVL